MNETLKKKDQHLAIEASRQARFESLLPIEFPETLPVSQRVHEIKDAIQNHQVVILCGETGSAKPHNSLRYALLWAAVLKASSAIHNRDDLQPDQCHLALRQNLDLPWVMRWALRSIADKCPNKHLLKL